MSIRILAFDPGGTTGVAFFHDETDPPGFFCMQLEGEHHKAIHDLLHEYTVDVVVCESFQNRKKDANLVSVEYIGVIKLVTKMLRIPLHLMTAAEGKGFWTNDKLKAVGMYSSKLQHANDAVRHALHYYTFKYCDNRLLSILRNLDAHD